MHLNAETFNLIFLLICHDEKPNIWIHDIYYLMVLQMQIFYTLSTHRYLSEISSK